MAMRRKRKFVARRRFKGRKLNKRQVTTVKRLIGSNQEHKYQLSSISGAGVSSTAAISLLHTIAQTTTAASDTTRIGDRIKWDRTGHLKMNIFSGGVSAFVRFICFQWKPNTVPVASSILLPGPTGNPDTMSHFSVDNAQLFHILFDKRFTLIGNGVASATTTFPYTTDSFRVYNWKYSPKNHIVQYGSGSSTVGTNLIYLLDVCDQNNPTFSFSAKIRYTDS